MRGARLHDIAVPSIANAALAKVGWCVIRTHPETGRHWRLVPPRQNKVTRNVQICPLKICSRNCGRAWVASFFVEWYLHRKFWFEKFNFLSTSQVCTPSFVDAANNKMRGWIHLMCYGDMEVDRLVGLTWDVWLIRFFQVKQNCNIQNPKSKRLRFIGATKHRTKLKQIQYPKSEI